MFADWAERFRVLGDVTGLKIVRWLAVREACVGEWVARLPVSQPTVSQQWRRLTQAGVVTESRHKAWTDDRLRTDRPPALAAWPADLEDAAWLHRHHVGGRVR